VRTAKAAVETLISLLEARLPIQRFALLHAHNASGAQALREKLEALIPRGEDFSVDITPVIGAHIGPGAIGYAIVTAPQ
jgi:fatty acid-binding protein DegV